VGTVALAAPGFSNEEWGAADHVKSWGSVQFFFFGGGVPVVAPLQSALVEVTENPKKKISHPAFLTLLNKVS